MTIHRDEELERREIEFGDVLAAVERATGKGHKQVGLGVRNDIRTHFEWYQNQWPQLVAQRKANRDKTHYPAMPARLAYITLGRFVWRWTP